MNNIYLLRHEQRGKSISFNSPLTDKGCKRSQNELCDALQTLNIQQIYCSPYIRTLQTILPFCEKYNLKVNLECDSFQI